MTQVATEAAPREASEAPRHRQLAEVNPYTANLLAVYVVWRRDITRFWRDRGRVIASLVQPLLYLVIFGTGLSSALRGAGGAGRIGAAGINYQQFIYPGVMGMTILFTAMFGAMSIVWDREFGFMKELLVAPISRSSVAIGKTLGGATQAMFQGVVLLLLAPFLGVSLTPIIVVKVLVLAFVLAFALSALGVAVASRMRSIQGFQVIMNFLMMPIFFLSGALFPLNGLPDWMTVLTRIDPASYGIDAIRGVVLGHGYALAVFGHSLSTVEEALIVIAFGLVMLGIGVFNFQQRD